MNAKATAEANGMPDIKASVKELQIYRERFFIGRGQRLAEPAQADSSDSTATSSSPARA